jgi:hypothetical protein
LAEEAQTAPVEKAPQELQNVEKVKKQMQNGNSGDDEVSSKYEIRLHCPGHRRYADIESGSRPSVPFHLKIDHFKQPNGDPAYPLPSMRTVSRRLT